jgi:hypothetical protein
MFVLVTSIVACGGGSTVPSATPAAPVAAPDAPAAGAKLALSGTINYAGPVTAQAVFVSVKDPSHPGPPLAAKKLPPGPFPMTFSLGDADVMPMGGGRAMPANVTLTVTLDGDGDAMSKDPADPKAVVETASEKADLKVDLAATPQ